MEDLEAKLIVDISNALWTELKTTVITDNCYSVCLRNHIYLARFQMHGPFEPLKATAAKLWNAADLYNPQHVTGYAALVYNAYIFQLALAFSLADDQNREEFKQARENYKTLKSKCREVVRSLENEGRYDFDFNKSHDYLADPTDVTMSNSIMIIRPLGKDWKEAQVSTQNVMVAMGSECTKSALCLFLIHVVCLLLYLFG